MIEDLKETKEKFKSIALSGPLKEVNLYQVNSKYFSFPKKRLWIIDGGIEFIFPSGVISAAWAPDMESLIVKNEDVKTIYAEDNIGLLNTDSLVDINKNVGHNLLDLEFKTRKFEYVVDYTMRTDITELFIELNLKFQYSSIQIAFIDYELEEDKAPFNYNYDVCGNILISIDNKIDIKSTDEE